MSSLSAQFKMNMVIYHIGIIGEIHIQWQFFHNKLCDLMLLLYRKNRKNVLLKQIILKNHDYLRH